MEKESKIVHIPLEQFSKHIIIRVYNKHDQYYAEIYDEQSKKSNALFKDELRKIFENLAKDSGDKINLELSNKIPEGLISFDWKHQSSLVWTCKEQPRKLYFTKSSGVSTMEDIMIPKMLFSVNERMLQVYFYTIKKDGLRQLYYTPFFNTNSVGRVCLPAMNVKTIADFKSIQEYMTYWERIFFDSPFSHSGTDVWPFKKSFPGNTFKDAYAIIKKEKAIKIKWMKKYE